jgi:hypothetical protein
LSGVDTRFAGCRVEMEWPSTEYQISLLSRDDNKIWNVIVELWTFFDYIAFWEKIKIINHTFNVIQNRCKTKKLHLITTQKSFYHAIIRVKLFKFTDTPPLLQAIRFFLVLNVTSQTPTIAKIRKLELFQLKILWKWTRLRIK